MDFPEGGLVAPEDRPLARPFFARTRLAFEMHYVNSTEEPILREAWVNLMNNEDADPSERVILGAPFIIGAMNVPAMSRETLTYQTTVPGFDHDQDPATPSVSQEMRLVSLFGHRHAHTERFSIWLHRDGGPRELVYEDYDWSEAREFFYNTVIENPLPDSATGTAGATSGLLLLQTGDTLEWECEVNNDTNEPLIFGNGVYVAEMCNVFGTLTADGYPIWYDCRYSSEGTSRACR
jgi:hypothetical protein